MYPTPAVITRANRNVKQPYSARNSRKSTHLATSRHLAFGFPLAGSGGRHMRTARHVGTAGPAAFEIALYETHVGTVGLPHHVGDGAEEGDRAQHGVASDV